ncbi:hypothetical protein EBU99_08370 [bacterium]|nr:hypothetical protein [bacterium]
MRPFVGLSSLALSLAGCAAGAIKTPANCPSRFVAEEIQNSMNHGLAGDQLNLNSTLTGIQALRGWMDLTWDADGIRKQKRCAMSLVPDVSDGTKVMIAAANHCLPEVPENSGSVVESKVHVYFRDGYIPISIDIHNLDKVLKMGQLINKFLVPLIPDAQLASWLPDYAASNCTSWTSDFRQGSAQDTKTACFSRTDLRIIDASVIETGTKQLELYKAALTELKRIRGASLADLPNELRLGIQLLWRSTNTEDIRKRNLRAFAYLSNVQYCAATSIPPPESIAKENEIFFVLDGKKMFCNMSAQNRDMFFKLSSTDAEFDRLKAIQNDDKTPLLELRNRHIGCDIPPSGWAEEMSSCQLISPTRGFFTKWVRDGLANFQLLGESERKGLTPDDYFNVVSPSHKSAADVGVHFFRLASNTERVAPAGGYLSAFLFDYLPSKNFFQFQKGDSGSVLNIFSGYPVAVLSTINGEPTSGGATVTPLPEPAEDAPTPSRVSSTCR